jgi:hypothetical protein
MLSSDATLHFEVMPFKLEKLINGKIIDYESYDENDECIYKGYIIASNIDDYIELNKKIYTQLQKKVPEKKLLRDNDYACFLKNEIYNWVLKKPHITDNVNKSIDDNIIIRHQ